jgi:hypothetical protein
MIAAFGILAVGLVSAGAADEPKKAADKAKNVESKVEKYQPATNIDFGAEFDLSFPSLATLGARIEQARRGCDPVRLAHLSNELALAEKLSKKEGSITSKDLLKQAARLAEMRGDAMELKAVALMVPDKEGQQKLTMLSEMAEKREKEESAALKDGQKPRGIWNELIVNNHSHQTVDIHYNGRHLGYVGPHGHKHFFVNDHSHEHYFDLEAWGNSGTHWSSHYHGDYKNFTWTLNP